MKKTFAFLLLLGLFSCQTIAAIKPRIVSTSPLPSGSLSQAYSFQFEATGGRCGAPYTWTVVGGAIPPGLSLASSGLLSGTPSSIGDYSFTLEVNDKCGADQRKTFSLSIATSSKLNQTISVTQNAPASAVYSTGFSVSATSSSGLAVAITSTGGCSGSGSGAATITMTSGTTVCAVHYNQAGNTSYNAAPEVIQNVTAVKASQSISFGPLIDKTIGDPDFTISATASSGLAVSFSSVTTLICTVSGSTVHLVASGLCTIRASQAGNANYSAAANVDQSFNVNPGPLQITTASLPNGTVGNAYGAQLAASGGTPPYLWSLSAGFLPAGLSLSSGGLISGTPSTAGTSNFTVRATDSASTFADKALSIVINAAPGGILYWYADMETGNLSQWTVFNPLVNSAKGGSFDSGACTRPPNGVDSAIKRRGSYSMKMTISTPGSSGCRQFRHAESVVNPEPLYYSVWFYVPELYSTPNGWWNVFQFKSETATLNNVFWAFDMIRRSGGGPLHLRIRYKELTEPGPFAGDPLPSNAVSFPQTIADVPIGVWFKLECYLKQSSDAAYDGRITCWQDSTQLYDLVNINTKFDGGDNRWSVNNYSDSVTPSPSSLYFDDAQIANYKTGPTSP